MNRLHTLLCTAFFAATTISAQPNPTVQQLQNQVDALKQRVAALELRLAKLEARPEPPRPPTAPLVRSAAPQTEKSGNILGNLKSGSNTLLDDLRNGFNSTSKPAAGPWTDPENWLKIQKGMARAQVEQILGQAGAVKSSIKLRVDDYWLYIGKLPSGDTLQGRVRFYKDKVTSWEHPKF